MTELETAEHQARATEFAIVINGELAVVPHSEVSYAEVVAIAYPVPADPNTTYTVGISAFFPSDLRERCFVPSWVELEGDACWPDCSAWSVCPASFSTMYSCAFFISPGSFFA